MTKVGEAPVYSSRLLEAGKALETPATFLQNLSRIFTKKDQLCVFNPTTHQHIATGITKADFTRLQKIDSRSGLGSSDLETARRILDSAGIATDKLGVKVLINLSQLVGSGKMSSADAQKLSKISSGALQEKLIDLHEKKSALAEKILQLGSDRLQAKLVDLVAKKPELAERIVQLKSETLQEKLAELH